MKPFRVFVGGDVVGKAGREVCQQLIPKLREEEALDFVVLNVENIAAGSGITESTTRELLQNGVDVMTTGDHVFKKRKEAEQLLERTPRIIRPANYPNIVPGCGSVVVTLPSGIEVGVVNVLGRVFLKTVDCPFQSALVQAKKIRERTPLVLVDFHAEATSEKVAMGWFLDGKVSAVFGTHTHVPTADETILPLGTGYVTDVGMCGSHESVIGRKIDQVLQMFLTQIPNRLEVAEGDARLTGAIFDLDVDTGKALAVRRVQKSLEPVAVS